ncbi:MAG TPA: tetratricopeptide repeat protein [Chitinophagaceae bacterium]|nr:tetratricopeptide repeat protein [Chitinophagaceae bacterium]
MKALILLRKHGCLFFTGLLLYLSPCSQQKSPAYTQVDDLLASAHTFFSNNHADSALSFFHQAIQVSRQKGYRYGEARGYDGLAEIWLQQGKYREINANDSLLLPLAIAMKDTALLINVYNRMGVCRIENGKAKEAEQYLQYALHYGLEKRQSVKTAEVFSNLGSVFLSTGDKDRAMDWFFRALKLYEANRGEKGMGETYSNISSIYYLMGRTDDAIQFQKKSIVLREKINDMPGLVITNVNIGQLYIIKDSFPLALQHLQKGVAYADALNNPRLQASAYSGISAYYSRTKDFSTTLQWQAKAIRIFEEADNKQMLSRLYVAAGNTASATNDSVAAVSYYLKALQLAASLGNPENIANAHEKLSNFYALRQDHRRALDHYKKFIVYKDSIAEKSALGKIEEIRTRYETEKKDNEIAHLTAEQQIQQLQIEKQEALIAGNLLEAQKNEDEIELLSRARQLQEMRISQQEEQLEKQSLMARNKEQQLQLAEQEKQLQSRQLKNSRLTRNFILAGIALLGILGLVLFNRYQLKQKIREQQSLLQVRSHIAKDLHDEIGSTLTSIKILSEVSGKSLRQDQQKASDFLQKITEQSAAAQQGMSDIVWAVKPENDKLENMVVRMREYIAQSLEPQNIQTSIHIDEALLTHSLSMQQRRDFFLIFKEAVNNIARHAAASAVDIRLDKDGDMLHLSIADNGRGFGTLKENSSNGLKNMQARAAALGGSLSVSAARGQGTELVLSVPFAT